MLQNTQGMGICFQLCHGTKNAFESFQNGDENIQKECYEIYDNNGK